MESEDITETNDWHTSQKDRDRERRRVRDRQRRQSMSQEERERHLARRRRNYQLRRQRASMMNSCSGLEMAMITTENLEPVPLTEVGFQFNVSNGYGAMYAGHDSSEIKTEGYVVNDTEERFQKLDTNTEGLRLHQIKHLARLLNTSSDKIGDDSSHCGSNIETSEISAVKCESRKTIRLVHVKRLARARHSTTELSMDGSSPIEEA